MLMSSLILDAMRQKTFFNEIFVNQNQIFASKNLNKAPDKLIP